MKMFILSNKVTSTVYKIKAKSLVAALERLYSKHGIDTRTVEYFTSYSL